FVADATLPTLHVVGQFSTGGAPYTWVTEFDVWVETASDVTPRRIRQVVIGTDGRYEFDVVLPADSLSLTVTAEIGFGEDDWVTASLTSIDPGINRVDLVVAMELPVSADVTVGFLADDTTFSGLTRITTKLYDHRGVRIGGVTESLVTVAPDGSVTLALTLPPAARAIEIAWRGTDAPTSGRLALEPGTNTLGTTLTATSVWVDVSGVLTESGVVQPNTATTIRVQPLDWEANQAGPALLVPVTTDATGAYSLTAVLPPGTTVVELAWMPDWFRHPQQRPAVRPGTNTLVVNLNRYPSNPLPQSIDVNGHLTAGGTPWPERVTIEVSFRRVADHRVDRQTVEVTPDPLDGSFHFTANAPQPSQWVEFEPLFGEWGTNPVTRVEPTLVGVTPVVLDVDLAGQIVRVSGTISGADQDWASQDWADMVIVVNPGAPNPSDTSVDWAWATVHPDGSYDVWFHAPAGATEVAIGLWQPSKDDYVFAPTTYSLAGGAALTGVDIAVVLPSIAVTGTVLRNGDPVETATFAVVWSRPPDPVLDEFLDLEWTEYVGVTPDDAGAYTLHAIGPSSATQATVTLLGLPVPVWVFLLVAASAFFVLRYTPFGRNIYAVGSNPEAARLSGINVGATIFGVYLISGF
ncbi:MAG TPA: hypothetical protein PLV68_19905, partial [Ilumatobacteraceae bacterium]|nr:hypothetical protein [Ilumatobacteraceae bacterium]